MVLYLLWGCSMSVMYRIPSKPSVTFQYWICAISYKPTYASGFGVAINGYYFLNKRHAKRTVFLNSTFQSKIQTQPTHLLRTFVTTGIILSNAFCATFSLRKPDINTVRASFISGTMAKLDEYPSMSPSLRIIYIKVAQGQNI